MKIKKIFKNVLQFLDIKINRRLGLAPNSIYSPKSISKKQLGEFVNKYYKKFYLRRRYMFNKLFEIRDFESWIRETKGFFWISEL